MIKRPLSLIAALLLLSSFTLWQHSESAAETNERMADQALDRAQMPQSAEPFWKGLERIPDDRAINARIEFESFGQLPSAAENMLAEIASIWNSGQPAQALALCAQLPAEFMLTPPAVGITWFAPDKQPVNEETPLWYTDVRIGTRDTIDQVAFDIHRASNHLFTVLKNQEGSTHYWHVNISTDMGQHWSETYSWWALYPTSISATVVANHCYVAYCYQGFARIRRFTAADGTSENFGDGSSFITVFSVSAPDSVKEVVITSNQDTYNNRLYYLGITKSNALFCLWDDPDALSWTEIITGVFNADRGLDACFNYGFSNYFLFISFLDTSGNLKILGWPNTIYLGENESGR